MASISSKEIDGLSAGSPDDGTTRATVGASAGVFAGGGTTGVGEVSAVHAALTSVTGVGAEVTWREPCPGSGWNTPTS